MSARFSLKGRTAVVTGGARGCGLSFAQGLAEAGADVVVLDLIDPTEEFHEISTKYSVKTWYFKVDVSSVASIEEAFSSFLRLTDGAIDICVACAGINRNLSFIDTDEATFDKLHAVNVRGAYFTAQMAAKAMIANKTTKGSIILVASIAASRAVRGQMSSAYCGTKGAVMAMCPPIAVELAQHGIRVNSISPGYVRTEMTAPFPHLLESWKDEIMNGRVAEPDDIRGACIFLASDASRYMTGHDIVVDGGVLKW